METAGPGIPRLAPPIPLRSLLRDWNHAAKELGIKPMLWQKTSARYLTALGVRRRWLYREVCIVVARQNGKTEILLPLILQRMRMGRRLLHTAQNRAIPRETFLRLAQLVNGSPEVTEIRFANGQELIRFANGGRYMLVAPRPGVRGYGVDDVLLDEVREQRSFDLIAAIKPTLTASRNPQIVYLSNAGDEDSVVLNELRRREEDPALAYIEWSAAPERSLDDLEGWAEANPALGITIELATLEDMRRSLPPEVFETEHMCRWVISMRPRLVSAVSWQKAQAVLETPLRPALGLSMDPSGTAAAAVIAWQQTDGSVGLQVLADVTGAPLDMDRFGPEVRQLSFRVGAYQVAYDPWTDQDFARHFQDPIPVNSREYANASENFVRMIESGRLHWQGAEVIGEQLTWTARKPVATGAWMAVKAKEERPVPAVLAAIRAVWLASGPRLSVPKVM